MFLHLAYEFVQIFITFNRTDIPSFKQVNEYVWKKNYPNFLYTIYKTQRMLEALLSHSSIAVFSFFFVRNAMNFFIHSLNNFFLKKLLVHCWFPSIKCPLPSLYMQIYLLNACEENLFDFYVESIAFRIKILMNVTSI